MIPDYLPKTEPDLHQRREFLATRDDAVYAHLWETGTGKSKVAIDTAAWNYINGRIDALIIIAPNGVHTNWKEDEIPKHLPDYTNPVIGYWTSQMTAAQKKAWDKAYSADHVGLRVFIFNVEGILPKGRSTAALRFLLQSLRCMLVLDESQTIGTPSAKRTKQLIGLSTLAPVKRILTGTWLDGNPLKAYSQFKFLDPAILGFQTYTSFKAMYCITERRKVNNKRGWYDHIVAFQNMDDLARRIRGYASILYKEECLSLPDKVYEKYRVEMTPEQKRIYRNLKEEGVATLGTDLIPNAGEDFEDQLMALFKNADKVPRVSVDNALTLLMRLQQVLGGYAKSDAGSLVAIPNNRLKALEALLESLDGRMGKVIIWSRFTEEINDIMALLGDKAVRYDGKVPISERETAKRRFIEDPKIEFFVGNPQVGARGLTLVQATYMIYYSQDFSRDKRKQSEDRAHRRGQTNKVTYFDMIVPGTVDEKISRALQDKEAFTLELEDMIRSA